MQPVIKRPYKADEIKIDPREVLRYLGYKKELVTADDIARVEGLLPEARSAMKPSACWSRFEVELFPDDFICFPYGQVQSHDLRRNFCSGDKEKAVREVFIFAATIGLDYDRLVQRSRITSMAKASFLNSIGAAAVENVCDLLNDELGQLVKAEGKELCPRYSPGYGDYTLENQRGIFGLLNPSKLIGLSLKDNLIMVPEKSVTAIIGIK